jgi:hypothetical protein
MTNDTKKYFYLAQNLCIPHKLSADNKESASINRLYQQVALSQVSNLASLNYVTRDIIATLSYAQIVSYHFFYIVANLQDCLSDHLVWKNYCQGSLTANSKPKIF